MSRRQPTPPPPTPANPEEDPGYREGLSSRRSDYRIRTNQTVYRVERRVLWLFWEALIDAPSLEWAERWIAEQVRRAAARGGKWETV